MTKTPFVIRNDLELSVALNRSKGLAGGTNDSSEESELGEICDAVQTYTESMRVLRIVHADPDKTDPFASKNQ